MIKLYYDIYPKTQFMTRNIFIAIATITFVVLVCINLFSPEQPSDYSYLKTFPESEKLELSENVVVENIDDLYYDYDTDFQGNVTTVYIHDKFSGGYGDGKFIFSYNGMRLDFDYEVKMYRPPYGFYNSFVDENITLPAILWELDTNDWSSRDADSVYESVFKYLNNHMILLFHDIYDSTGSALSSKGIIERLIDEGYQLVTVSELAKIRGVELTQGTHLGW